MVARALALLLLAGGVGGTAWALGATEARRFDAAATYHVTDAVDPALPPDGQVGKVANVLRVGNVLLQGECMAGTDPTTQLMTASIVFRVVNTGDDRVLVVRQWIDLATPGPWVWLDPGGKDPLFWAGQMAGSDIGTQADVTPFVVVENGGTSATGLAGWWVQTNEAERTADCMFTAQAKG